MIHVTPMLPISATLALVLQYQQEGRFQEAAAVCHRLGEMLQQEGYLDNAAVVYQAAVQFLPDDADLYYKLAVIEQQRGRLTEAIAAYRAALRIQPAHVTAHNNLGIALQVQGDLPGALQAYRTAIYLQPDYHEAYNNLGIALQTQGELFAAASAFRVALSLHREDAEAQNNLGVVLQAQGDLKAAATCFYTALRLRPNYPEAYNNLGMVLWVQGNLPAASAVLQTALRLRPHYPEAYNNLGAVLVAQGDFAAAEAAFEAALAILPEYAEAHWNRSLVWLTQGRLGRGWPAYEWRWQALQWPERQFPQQRWDGSLLKERTLLVYAEQGVGDELLFAACLPELIAQAGHVVLAGNPRLTPLYARSFPTATVRDYRHEPSHTWLADVPPIDLHIPIGSLPLFLRRTLGHFPMRGGYLQPHVLRQTRWEQRLALLGAGRKIGFAWRSLAGRQSHVLYTRLEEWEGILTCPGVHWVNLQYDGYDDELTMAQQRWGVALHTWEDLDVLHDLDEVAALISALDLVIVPETMMAALAGSLGQPVWRLAQYVCEWDILGTAVLPWFPTMRLYRQPQPGDWRGALARIARDLHRWLGVEARKAE
jgi:tetratricopeptide (TPR) repeat protein